MYTIFYKFYYTIILNSVIIYFNNFWFWIELPGAGIQYFILENCRDQFTLGSVYTSLVHNFQYSVTLTLLTNMTLAMNYD